MAYKLQQNPKGKSNEPLYLLMGLQCPKCGFVHEVRVPADYKTRRNFVVNSICPGIPGLKCGHSASFGIKYVKDPDGRLVTS